jgi:hypothetical protein
MCVNFSLKDTPLYNENRDLIVNLVDGTCDWPQMRFALRAARPVLAGRENGGKILVIDYPG